MPQDNSATIPASRHDAGTDLAMPTPAPTMGRARCLSP